MDKDKEQRDRFYKTTQEIADAIRDGSSLLGWDVKETLSDGRIEIFNEWDNNKLIATLYVAI